MIGTAATTWPEAASYFAIAFGLIGVAWAFAWFAVNSDKHDPFWNRQKHEDADE